MQINERQKEECIEDERQGEIDGMKNIPKKQMQLRRLKNKKSKKKDNIIQMLRNEKKRKKKEMRKKVEYFKM